MLPTACFSNFLPLEVDCRRQGTIVAIIRFSAFLRRLWKVDLLTPLLLAIASVVTCAFASEFEMLFTFLQRHNVPLHNNRAENAIRQGVLHRKISGGRRTWNGAHVLECIMSVYRTFRKKGRTSGERSCQRWSKTITGQEQLNSQCRKPELLLLILSPALSLCPPKRY